jgi:DNA-binding response OmpR family regulator
MIVEDDEAIRQELSILLKNALFQVTEINQFTDAAAAIQNTAPDLVLLDINLPGASGMDICKEIRRTSEIPIIFITGNNTAMNELSCLQFGGDDFIAKPFNPPVLLARISALLKRTVKDAGTLRFSRREVTLDIAAAMLEANGKKTGLTKNELKILHFLFIHSGNFVSRADLTDYLWDNQVFIDDNTLSVNMTRIRGKLNEIGAGHFIETKRGLGYKLI